MMQDPGLSDQPRPQPDPMSALTKSNVRRSRTWKVTWGATVIEWKFKTDLFRLKPERSNTITEFFQVGLVHWRTWKWLTFGLSIYTPVEPDPHERMPNVR